MTSTTAPPVDSQHVGDARPTTPPWHAVLRLVGPAAVLTLLVPSLLLRTGWFDSEQGVAAAVSWVHSATALAAAAAILRPVRSMVGRSRVAWTFIGVATLLWAVSNTMWLIGYALGRNPDAMRSIPAFTIANSVLLAGAVLLPASTRRVASLRRLDTAIMMVAAACVLWVMPLTRLLGEASADHDPLIYGTLCAIKMLTVLVAMGAFVRCRPDQRNEIPPLAFALILLTVADVLFVSGRVADAYPVQLRTADAVFTATLLLLLVAGRRLSGTPVTVPARQRPLQLGRALPELFTVGGLVVLALDRQFRNDGTLGVPVALAASLVLLAIVRLGWLEYEQRRLTATLRSSAERLYEDARVDALTGLGNRMSLDERLERAAARRPQHGGSLSLFFIDVDHFKRFNDGLGHHAGDGLLVEVARRLSDVFGEDTVHRVGGDEFVALRADVDARTAEVLACDAVSIASEPVLIDGHELNCTVSVGMAQMSREANSSLTDRSGFADTLLRRADLALYAAKERGRNQWASYDPSLQHRADERLRMQQQLHAAIERGEIEVHHRPVVELATRRTVGLSATLRWRSPDHGLLAPEAFMGAVIDGGMLPQVFRILFDQVADALREADRRGVPIEWISAPVRRDEIVHPGLVDCVSEALADAQVPPERLRIAVAEDTVVDDAALDVIHELRRLGVHLSVHHFGTGPSSLLSLGRYPASTITVDESFIEGLGRRRDDTLIVTAVAGLTADLDMELAAEGISEEFQVELLVGLGCAHGQGRLFGDHAPLDRVIPVAYREPAR